MNSTAKKLAFGFVAASLFLQTESFAMPVAKQLAVPSNQHEIVYHGTPVATTGKTWQYVVNFDTDFGSCTGFFIDYDTMLTAAHCFKNNTRPSLALTFFNGSEFASYSTYEPNDYRMIIYPSFNFQNKNSQPGVDVAVIMFRKRDALSYERSPGTIISSANTSSINVGDMALMVGAGKSDLNVSNGDLRFYSATVSSSGYNNSLVLEAARGGGICRGDSGGPALWRSARTGLTNYYIMGITSGMDGTRLNDDCSTGAGYTMINSVIGAWIYKAQERLTTIMQPLREAADAAERARAEAELKEEEEYQKLVEARKNPHVRMAEEAATLQKVADAKALELTKAQENLKRAQDELRKAEEAVNVSDESLKKARAAAQAKAEEARKAREAYEASKALQLGSKT